jgi:hypothetical protein
MRPYHRVDVQLSKKDRKQIAGMLNKGRESARVLRRALILQQLDQGQTAGMEPARQSQPGENQLAIRPQKGQKKVSL